MCRPPETIIISRLTLVIQSHVSRYQRMRLGWPIKRPLPTGKASFMFLIIGYPFATRTQIAIIVCASSCEAPNSHSDQWPGTVLAAGVTREINSHAKSDAGTLFAYAKSTPPTQEHSTHTPE